MNCMAGRPLGCGSGIVWVPRTACPPVPTLAASCQWHPSSKRYQYLGCGDGRFATGNNSACITIPGCLDRRPTCRMALGTEPGRSCRRVVPALEGRSGRAPAGVRIDWRWCSGPGNSSDKIGRKLGRLRRHCRSARYPVNIALRGADRAGVPLSVEARPQLALARYSRGAAPKQRQRRQSLRIVTTVTESASNRPWIDDVRRLCYICLRFLRRLPARRPRRPPAAAFCVGGAVLLRLLSGTDLW